MSDVNFSSKKKLCELKVKDLRQQLEKRGLDRSGIKTALVERLTKALQDDGQNPDDFLFDVVGEAKTPTKSPAVKRPSRKNRDNGELAQDDGDVEEDEEDEKQAEQENKKELNKDQDTHGEKQDVNKFGNPGSQKVLHYNGSKEVDSSQKGESSSQVAGQLSPLKSPSVTVRAATKSDKHCFKKENDSSSMIVNSADVEEMGITIDEKQNVGSECKYLKANELKSSDRVTNEASYVSSEISNSSKEIQESNSLAKDEVQKTKVVIITDVKDAPSKRTSRESTETSTAATDEKSLPNSEASNREKAAGKAIGGRENLKNLWICGLTSKTRAADLKALFTTYGRVNSAKIVTSAKAPSSRFGFVAMATSESATASIQHLHNTEFHGGIISVEKTSRELHKNGAIKRAPQISEVPAETDRPSQEETGVEQSDSNTINNEIKNKIEEVLKNTEDSILATNENESQPEEKEEKRKYEITEERRSRKLMSQDRDRISRSRGDSRDWRGHGPSRPRVYGRMPVRGGFYRAYNQRNYSDYNDKYREEREVRRPYPSHSRYPEPISNEELRLECEKEMLRLEKEKLEIERLKLEKERHRFEREQLELDKAELRARRFSHVMPDHHRAVKRPFDARRGKGDGRHWIDRKRSHESFDTPGGTHSLRLMEYSRASDYHDKRSERYEGRSKGDIRQHMSGSSRHEGRHVEGRIFVRGRHDDAGEKRTRDDWKSKARGRFERSSGSRGFPSRHSYENSNPWNNPNERALKFSSGTSGGQWGPMKSDNWGRIDGPPAKRWANVEPRGQQSVSHLPNQQEMFGGSENAMMSGNFPPDHFGMDSAVGRF